MRFLGIEAEGAASCLRFAENRNIDVLIVKRQTPGVQQKFHYVAFGLRALWATFRWRPGFVYASDPIICPIALVLSYVPGLSAIYHEHDSPDSEMRGSLKKKFLLYIRKTLARRALANVLPSRGRISEFSGRTGVASGVFCVMNAPDRAEAASPPSRSESIVRIFYHGTIVPNRLPLTVIEAIAQANCSFELIFAGYETTGHPGYVHEMEARAVELQISERLHHLGAIPKREALLQQARSANIGIALMPMLSKDINEKTMAGASNKAFDYLACGLPLLVSDLPDWNEMFVTPGYARACDPTNPASIARALQWFAENPEETRDMGERGRQRILRDWNYQRQFAPVLEELERTIRTE